MSLGDALAPVNAALNLSAGTLLVMGWRAIKGGDRARHRRLMIGAVTASALFLASYLVRFALTGTHRFPGEGALRAFYLVLLGSHTVLAAAVAPLALRTLFLGLRERFDEHRRVARWTFPAWVYVSATGVLVYVMLYHVAPAVAAAP